MAQALNPHLNHRRDPDDDADAAELYRLHVHRPEVPKDQEPGDRAHWTAPNVIALALFELGLIAALLAVAWRTLQ